jgi:hypothetical protein
MILKHTYKWASYNGEEPFAGYPIGRAAQQVGVLEASNWFFEDARVIGDHGPQVQQSVERLATFFRRLRFSDKPVESSLITFSDSCQLLQVISIFRGGTPNTSVNSRPI